MKTTQPSPNPIGRSVRTGGDVRGSASDQEDVLLMRRVAEGDTLAFDILYQRYTPRLIGYLQSRFSQSDLIEEVCHDVMLVVWQQAAQFDPSKRLSTWLLGIARNKALMSLRAQAPLATHPTPPSPDYPDENPEGLLAHREHQQLVSEALTTLTPEERHLITLVYEHEQSYREIALSLGCPVNTLKGRIRRIRQGLIPTLSALEVAPARAPRRRSRFFAEL